MYNVSDEMYEEFLGGIYKRFLLKLPFANYRFFEEIAENTIGLNT